MPTLRRRHTHMKVFRPDGTKYTEGEESFYSLDGQLRRSIFPTVAEIAIKEAISAFVAEFKRWPSLDEGRCLIELVVMDDGIKATLLELPKED